MTGTAQDTLPAPTGEVVSPIKLAHIVFRTSRFDEMIAWYKRALNAKPAYEGDDIAFLAYDDEHHRVAFIRIPELKPTPDGVAGVHHIAFTFADLGTLLDNYARLKAMGIEPAWSVNHGPTTSMYYNDPDGNQLEFQVDNYDTIEDATAFFFSKDFDTNPIGVDFDPEELRRKFLNHKGEGDLRLRPPSGPRGVDSIPIR